MKTSLSSQSMPDNTLFAAWASLRNESESYDTHLRHSNPYTAILHHGDKDSCKADYPQWPVPVPCIAQRFQNVDPSGEHDVPRRSRDRANADENMTRTEKRAQVARVNHRAQRHFTF